MVTEDNESPIQVPVFLTGQMPLRTHLNQSHDDLNPNQNFTSLQKSHAPVAFGSKTFTPAQIKMSFYAKQFLAIYFAFKDFGHYLRGKPKPVIIFTDRKAVTRFFQTKSVPLILSNACDYLIQSTFVIAQIQEHKTQQRIIYPVRKQPGRTS